MALSLGTHRRTSCPEHNVDRGLKLDWLPKQ
jgi:hypothetical protein